MKINEQFKDLSSYEQKKKFNLKNIKNPQISYNNENSHFIYNDTDVKRQFEIIKNKNLIKPSSDDIDYLKQITFEINNEKFSHEEKTAFVNVPEEYIRMLNNFTPKIIEKKNEIIDFIFNTLEKNKNRETISCRKLAALYEEKYGKKIGKSTIHKIMRRQMDYRYLKTVYKSKKIENFDNKLYSFYFIKAFVKFLKVGFELIFVDESKIELLNNHYKCWRRKDEQICFGTNNKHKKNLILAITKDEIAYYEILEKNTNSNIFLEFLENLFTKKIQSQNKKFVLIMDNCTSHKTNEIIEFFLNKKINIIYTPPYQSIFNPIELAFRALKRIIYSKIYSDIDELMSDVKDFFESKELKRTLLLNYKESIEQYINFYNKYKYMNLNNSNVE